jgi:kynureninase
MAPLQASLAIFEAAGMDLLRQKSKRMSAYLEDGIRSLLESTIEILTPTDPEQRGNQLSLRVRAGRLDGQSLFQHLAAKGVVADWREPDVIRVAPAPLYCRFEDGFALLQNMHQWAQSSA